MYSITVPSLWTSTARWPSEDSAEAVDIELLAKPAAVMRATVTAATLDRIEAFMVHSLSSRNFLDWERPPARFPPTHRRAFNEVSRAAARPRRDDGPGCLGLRRPGPSVPNRASVGH